MLALAIGAVLSTMHYEGPVAADGGDYLDVAIDVPAGTKQITIHHEDRSDTAILDFGVWDDTNTFRGWGGGNSEDIVIGVDQSSRSYLPGAIAAGSWHLVIGKAHLDPATMYYADVTCEDAESLAVEPRAAFAAVTLSPDRRWYAGDFHVHSTESGDAQATFAQIRDLATTRGLDFVNLSDHNTVSQHALIAALQPMMPHLLFLRGAEVTTYHGHGNAVGISQYVDHRIGFAGRDTPAMIADVNAQGGVFIVNHPALNLPVCIGCAWDHPDTPWDQVGGIEVITGNYDLGILLFVDNAIALWDAQEDAGHRIAAIGGSDDHTAGMSTDSTASPIGSPTTLVYADNLSEAAIVAAVKAHRTIVKLRAPDDPDLDVTMSDHDIGDDVPDITDAAVHVQITGATGMTVALVRDGDRAHPVAETVVDDDAVVLTDPAPETGDHRYRIELYAADGNLLEITSHFYAHLEGKPGDDSLCSSSRGGGSSLALIGLGLLVAGRRRRR